MADSFNSVALIIGVTGIVGNSLARILQLPTTPGGPWEVYGVGRRPLPPWIADYQIQYIQCDTNNAAETHAKLTHLTDVTNIFWVAWTAGRSGHGSSAESCEANGAMFRNVLAAIIPNAPKLRHICLQTGALHYRLMQTAPPVCEIRPHDPPFTEDMPRLNNFNYYYTLEDVLFEEISKRTDQIDNFAALTWSVHRPGLIFGFSPQSLLNIIGTLCVYAAICKQENIPFKFPGTTAAWKDYSDASDADLIAEQQIWAALDPNPRAKNEAFNITNGDLIQWKHLWRILSEEFDLDFMEFDESVKPTRLVEIMKDKGPVWDRIVRENELMVTKVEDVGLWGYVDAYLGQKAMLQISCMNKSKEHGFLGFRNSKTSFLHWVRKLKARKIVP